MFAEELLCLQLVGPGAKGVLGMLWAAEHQCGSLWVLGWRQSFLSALQGSAEAEPSVMP